MSDASAFRPALEHALNHSLAHLESLKHSPVTADASLHTLRERLMKPLNSESMPAEQVIDELVACGN